MEHLAALLKSRILDELKSMLEERGLPNDLVSRFAEGISTMNITEMQERLELVVAVRTRTRTRTRSLSCRVSSTTHPLDPAVLN